MEEYYEYPLPHWADRISDGYYMVVGSQLSTRDGRKVGNAYVDRIYYHNRMECSVAVCYTDAGNTLRLTLDEMREYFHRPRWIMSMNNARAKFKPKDGLWK